MTRMTNLQKQKNLKYLGYYQDDLDGVFGKNSKGATKLFQRDYKLDIDGIFGEKTILKSISVWKNIQVILTSETGIKLVIDGLCGNATIGAIKIFQNKRGLKATGIVDKITLSELLNDNTKEFICPVNYIQITSPFGKRIINGVSKYHYGIDFGHCSKSRWNDNKLVQNKVKEYDGENHFILASEFGTVVSSSYSSSYGYYIKINHGDGLESFYAHLLKNSMLVKVGDLVKKGDSIARMGTTGASAGVHLHFEIRVNGGKTNPLPYLHRTKEQAIGNSIIDGDYIIPVV